jgi:hypothetical protein
MRRIHLIGLAGILLGLAIAGPAHAAGTKATPFGETYVTFLEIAQGARATGLGDAYVSLVDDVSAVFFNASALTDMPKNKFQFTFTHTMWFADSKLNSGAIGVNTDYGAFGFSVVTYGTPDIEETTIFKPNGTGRVLDTGSWAIGFAYAKRFTDRFALGGQIRGISEKLDQGYDFRTYDVAVGTKYYSGWRNLRIAMSMRNFGPDKVLLKDELFKAKMPADFAVSAAAEVIGTKEDQAYLTGVVEYGYSASVHRRLRVGAEVWLRDILALRGGYKHGYDIQDYTLGAGVNLKRGDRFIRADFAWQNIKMSQFDPPLRFSVTGSF